MKLPDSVRPKMSQAMTKRDHKPFPPSVNFHFLKACNMSCRFCFARFPFVMPVGREVAVSVSRTLAESFEKITFVGGEPTLCPWLNELLQSAKACGRTTMVVTNGSLLTRDYLATLKGVLDWIGLSVDSGLKETNVRHGRCVRGTPIAAQQYESIANWAHEMGMKLKVNVVVSALNADEDLSRLLSSMRPERIKIMRVLPIRGQNDKLIEPLLVSGEAFQRYADRHRHLESMETSLAVEDTDDLRGSYAMVDPAGRFFDNVEGYHTYSSPIQKVGIERAWRQVSFRPEAFARRGGHYTWAAKRYAPRGSSRTGSPRHKGCQENCQKLTGVTVSSVED